MSFIRSPFHECWEIAESFACQKQVCPCTRFVTVEMQNRRVEIMSNGYVTLQGELKIDGGCSQDHFGSKPFSFPRCAHDIDVHIRAKITMNQWVHVASKYDRFILVHAVFDNGVLDTTGSSAGVICSPDLRVDNVDQTVYTTFELFSGGFSGWSHVLRRLQQIGHNFHHKISVDFDPQCAEAYCRSHGFVDMVGPTDMIWDADQLPDRLFIQGDVIDPRWYHLLSDEKFDLSMMSPPCPAWSKATACPGITKHEGRLTLYSWALLNLIRPRVACMEMVGSMKGHEHWPLVKAMILWAGYSIRYAKVLNLAEFSPQHRERLIVVATLDGEDHHSHICTQWPPIQRHTLETYLNILEPEDLWIDQTSIDSVTLSQYMDPALLPKSSGEHGRPTKKSRKDVEAYRIKYAQSVFGCIMASYGSAHELPSGILQQFGLYGTILAQAKGLRFLSTPVIAISFSALMPFWMPLNHKETMKMLGNAIAIPHAMVGILNAMAFLAGYSSVEIQDIMRQVMNARFTSRNLRWERKWGGISFTKDEDSVQPTLEMHANQKVEVHSPTDLFVFHAEREILLWEALKIMTGRSMPCELFLMPAGSLDAKVTLPKGYEIIDQQVAIFSAVPCVLDIGPEHFAVGSNDSSCIIVLTVKGLFVLRRDHGMTCQDVLIILNHHFGIRCNHMVGMLGERHQDLTLCPNAVIARDIDSSPDNLQVLNYVQPKVEDGTISFASSHEGLSDFATFLHDTGTSEMIQALGWCFMTDVDSFIHGRAEKVLLTKMPSTLAIPQEEVIYCLAIYFFLTRIRSWRLVADEPTIRCRVKLWHVWIWDTMVDKQFNMSRFEEDWNQISALFKINKPWRFVANGRCLNPSWPLEGFAEEGQDGETSLTIFMQLGSRGGGPARLRSSSQVSQDGNLRDLAEFERANFTAALNHILQDIVFYRGTTSRCDISNFFWNLRPRLPMVIMSSKGTTTNSVSSCTSYGRLGLRMHFTSVDGW